GAGAYGVAAAARAYFAAPLRELDAAQTALIAGMAQAPGRTNPHRRPRPARMRRDEVLTRMAAAGFISADEAAAARAQPLALRAPPKRYGSVAPWHTEHVRRQLAKTHPAALGRGGLRIDTAALPGLAARSEILAREWSSALGRGRPHGPPQLGAVVWDHRTGYVEAMVGGLSWTDSRFDRAAQACRQPGSAFKPIVYAAALVHDAITPGTALRDAPIAEYDEDLQVHWKPDNSGRSFRGVALAQDALAASLNAAAVDVLDRVGGARVIAVARRLGLTTELADVRPLALGASCVIPLELAGAYAIFAQDGARVEPIFAVRVSRGGRVLFDRASPRDPHLEPRRRLDRFIAANAAAATGATEPVIDRYSAFLMSTMLAEVVKRGTATAARRLGRPAAGKTGTTNDNTDAWFVGYTGRLVAAVWVGHDDPARTLGRSDDGSRAALPLWIRLIAAAEGERPPRAVPGPPPDGLRQARIDRETGKRAPPGVGGGALLYFKPGTEPIEQTGHIPGVPSDLSRAAREF
ncbi:MAG: penicillin-binding transpeptidase domain-containing protein, partial [Myxococcota bacterium]